METMIALAGNPNSGKTTMFNDLTGANQYVGNWPGVTVEKKSGKLRGNKEVTVVDLPGVYSLSPYSPEEVVSRDYLLSGEPAAVLDIVDGTNIERNLYLSLQLMEVGLPMVVALNMADLIRKNGDAIDLGALSKLLGCPVVKTSALKGEGTKKAAEAALQQAKSGGAPTPCTFAAPVEEALAAIAGMLSGKVAENRTRWYAVKLFERDEVAQDEMKLGEAELAQIEALIKPVEEQYDDDSESIITSGRYDAIADIMAGSVRKKAVAMTTSDKIDRIVTNRFLALPIFAAIMFLVYYISIMSIGDWLTGWANDTLFGEWIGGGVLALMEGANVAPYWWRWCSFTCCLGRTTTGAPACKTHRPALSRLPVTGGYPAGSYPAGR